MQIPESPPEWSKALRSLWTDGDRYDRACTAVHNAGGDGKYLHWDKLRHLKVPEGLSHEQWWAVLKVGRTASRKAIPLQDIKGIPFSFGSPDPVQELLHRTDQTAGGCLEIAEPEILSKEARDRYLVRSLVEESITSSQLEGATTTRPVAKKMIRSGRKPTDRSEQMIVNNYWAMKEIRKQKKNPLTPELVLRFHEILTREALDNPSAVGRLRRTDEPVEVVDMYGEVFHTPPPAKQLEKRMRWMCDFANGKIPNYFIHPVIRAIILHFWLAYDHPFVDGNGRCARGLFYWSMLHQRYWLCEYISISEIIRKGPAKYGRAFLYTETDSNDLTYFILYHLDVIRRATEQLHSYIASKVQEVRRTQRLLKASTHLNHRQLALLTHALRHPDNEYTIASHGSSHDVAYQTARNDLIGLADKRLLGVRKIGRKLCFYPVSNLAKRL